MPPVVEGRRSDHREAAPRADEGAEGAAEAEHVDGGGAPFRVRKSGPENQVAAGDACDHAAQLDRDMRGCPERIAADRAVPGNIPMDADHGRSNAQYGEPD